MSATAHGDVIVRGGSAVTWIATGAIAGLAGGVVFGLAMIELGSLPTVASIVRVDSEVVGFFVHMTIAAVVGALFAVFVWHQQPAVGETLLWGLAYGALFWFVGPLTLLPSFLGNGANWTVAAAQAGFPSLMGHLLWGATAAVALVSIRREGFRRPSGGDVAAGVIAGLVAAWVAGLLLDAQSALNAFSALPTDAAPATQWLAMLGLGVLAGATFAALYPGPDHGAGGALIRGMMFGFLWWVVAPQTVLPLIGGDKLPWTVAEIRESFAALFAYLLFGGCLGLGYGRLIATGRFLFADPATLGDDEGAGIQGLRAVGRGTVAGIAGGLVFTVVMLQVGALEGVASLIRSDSEATGFVVHLVIATIIGSTYGMLFRHQSFDVGSAIGWGVAYGFFWWVLGPQTLAPIIRGAAPNWSADIAGGLTANLVGHLGYGVALALTYYSFERRFSPWWVPRRAADAARAARKREIVLTAAPALWALAVVLAIVVPIVLGNAPAAGTSGYPGGVEQPADEPYPGGEETPDTTYP